MLDTYLKNDYGEKRDLSVTDKKLVDIPSVSSIDMILLSFHQTKYLFIRRKTNMIQYTTSLNGVTVNMLSGFFVDWRNPPAPGTHLDILQNSRFVVLAIDDETSQIVGFANALSDGIMSLVR